ncbi:zinc finger, CCHC-type containing protein [Tanacetum coccineum]
MDVIDLEDDSIDAEILNSMSVSNEHFQTALGPTNSFAVLEVPICSCDDIGGLKNVKRELQEKAIDVVTWGILSYQVTDDVQSFQFEPSAGILFSELADGSGRCRTDLAGMNSTDLCLILNGMSDPFFDIYQNVESFKKLWDSLEAKYMVEDALSKKLFELTLVELGNHLRIEESLRVQDSDKPKCNNVAGPSVINMVEHDNSSRYNKNKGKSKHHDNTKDDLNKKAKPTCWKCGKTGHIKKDCKDINVGNKANGPSTKDDDVAWWVDSGETFHVCKDGSTLHMGNESTAWHAILGHVYFKMMQDMYKDGLIPTFDMDAVKCKTCMLTKITKKPFQNVKRKTKVLELIHNDLCDLHATPSLGNKRYFVIFIDDALRFCYVYLLHSKDEALDKFKVFKTEVELQQGSLIKRFRTVRGGEYMDTLFPNKRNMITPYELLTERKPNLNYLMVWGCKAVVRLPDPKLKNVGERGIECIVVGYLEHSKAFKLFVIESNESVSINLIIELRDAIFDDNRFSSVPRPNLKILNGTEDICGSMVPKEATEEFDDPKTFDEAMKSQDVAFWKEAINVEMDSIMGNNTWVLADLLPGCKPLGCKWIIKRKLKPCVLGNSFEDPSACLNEYVALTAAQLQYGGNAIDLPTFALSVLVTRASQSRQHDSISALLLFGDQRLERTATFSISTISEWESRSKRVVLREK